MFRKSVLRSVFVALFVLLTVGIVAVNFQSVPVKAQGGATPTSTATTATDDEEFSALIEFSGTVQSITQISGPVSLITLDDTTVIKVNPGTQVSGGALVVGVLVTGTASVEDEGLVAKTLVVGLAPTATATTTATATSTADVTPTTTLTSTPTLTPSASASASAEAQCGSGNIQPVAARLAEAFNVPYDEIMGWHCKGFGFGEIARAYLLAQKSGMTVEEIFAMRTSGQGWGQIIKKSGVNPKDLAPGQVINKGKGKNKGSATPPGKGKGKGHN